MQSFGNIYRIFNGVPPFHEQKDDSLQEQFVERHGDGIDRVGFITDPTLTFFEATGAGPHPAVLVCPGGGYSYLAWNLEGLDICAFLNTIGISAFLLKYRCPNRRTAAHADAARAIRYIRAHAEKLHVCKDKIGAIGFSAGAHLCASISAPADESPYEPADAVDKESFRPNFTLLIYPAYLVNENMEIMPEFKIDSQVPPMFLAQTEDDGIRVENAIGWFLALKRAGVQAELHVWPEGGHGYGVRRTGNACMEWPVLAASWLRRQTGLL